VAGDSMSPEFREGDFVVIATHPFPLRLNEGDVIVFNHTHYGTLIKRILRFDANREIYVIGAHADSLDSSRLGPIRPAVVRGRVIWHIPKPR